MTLAQMQTVLLTRLGDDPTLPITQQHYTPAQCTAAINMLQRLFVLMTLCLETTGSPVALVAGTAYYAMLGQFSDWLVPLRIRDASGKKIKPCRLADMVALDSNWSTRQGTLSRYALVGFDLLGIYKSATTTITVTYARCPVVLAAGTDVPEIPERYHTNLIDGAIPLMRTKEGMQEWQKTLFLWDRFMDAAAECAGKVKARNMEQGYDNWPQEMKHVDRSTLLKGMMKSA